MKINKEQNEMERSCGGKNVRTEYNAANEINEGKRIQSGSAKPDDADADDDMRKRKNYN